MTIGEFTPAAGGDVANLRASSEWNGLPPRTLGVAEWPEQIQPPVWQEVFGRPPAGVFVVIDPQVGESHGQLRALPLLRALGIRRFTFPNGWRGLDVVPYEWLRIAEDTAYEDLVSDLPICQFVSQSIEDQSLGDASYKLLRAQQACGDGSLLVFVFDTSRFARRRGVNARPFIDEYNLRNPVDYRRLSEFWASHHLANFVPPLVSRNLAWQGLAQFRLQSRVPQHLEDVLNLNQQRADSPIWELFAELCRMAGPEADGTLVRQSLRSWVDAEITKSTDHIVMWLQRKNYSVVELEKLRTRQARREP